MWLLFRRRLLAIAVSACLLDGLAIVAAPALSAVAPGPVKTRHATVEVALAHQRDVELPMSASHVVLHWKGNPHAALGVAFRQADGTFSPAEPVEIDDDGPDQDPGVQPSDETFGQVLIADGATAIRVTSDRPIARLTVEALDTRGSALQQAADAALAASGVGTASAAEPEPAIISRAGWGADESYRLDSAGHEKFPRSYYPLQKLIVHHTAGKNNDTNPAATIRAIYYDHAVIRGYGDIDYNFLIDAQGHVYQGRYSGPPPAGQPITGEDLAGNPVRAGHAKGFNAGTIGISLLGNFTSVQPTSAARTALIRMLAWESERHGLNPLGTSTYVNPETGATKSLYNISGHRNVNVTACPGEAFYDTFPTLRQQVANEIAAHTGATVDTTAPGGFLAPMLSPTGGSTTTFGLRFLEPVKGLTADDFTVGGTSEGWAVTDLAGTASTYTVTVHSDAPTDGTVVLTLPADSVTDLAGNTGPPDPIEATATFATDTTGPTGQLWWTPHLAALNVTWFDLTLTFSEPVVGLSLDDIKLGGTSDAATPWSFIQPAILGSGANWGFSVEATNPASGTVTITVPAGATTDAAGNPNAEVKVSVLIDRTAPSVATPRTSIRTGVTYSSSVAARVTWTGTDNTGGSGVASYDIERSVDGGAYKVLASKLTGTGYNVSLASGHTYRFAVRARDKAGNTGGWRAGATTSTLVRQDSSSYLHYSSGWHTLTSTSYSGGTLRYATTAGAYVSYSFTGRAIALVTTKAPARGAVKVYVDGTYVKTVDLYRSSTAFRQVAWATSWASAGSHTIKLVVVGTAGRPRVDVDALLVLR